MTINFEYTYQTLEFDDINKFEKNFNIYLPDDYKSFLLKNNGGKSNKRRFKTSDGTITTSIMLFLPISKEVELNLNNFYTKYNLGKIVPSNFLPIGIDPADSLICLEIGGEGKVYFCDMDYFEEDNELKEEYISVMADNFTMFLENLSEA